MIPTLAYALVLIVHPSPEPRIYATFSTAAECRTQRIELSKDLADSNITVACVPQNQVSFEVIQAQMQQMITVLRGMSQQMITEAEPKNRQ